MPLLKRFLAVVCLFGLAGVVVAQDPPALESPEDDAETQFIQRLNDFVQSYLSDAPTEAKDFQEAVRQFQSEQAELLLNSLQLPQTFGLLTDAQISTLEKLELRYRDTEAGRIATDRLREHYRLADEPKAQDALKAAGVKIGDLLTPDQVAALEKIRSDFPNSDAAKAATNILGVHRRREADAALSALIEEFKTTPGAREALSRFADRRLQFALSLVEPQQKIRLADLVRNFPGTQAAERAAVALKDIEARSAARAAAQRFAEARSANYRYYWDMRYPTRTWQRPATPQDVPTLVTPAYEMPPAP